MTCPKCGTKGYRFETRDASNLREQWVSCSRCGEIYEVTHLRSARPGLPLPEPSYYSLQPERSLLTRLRDAWAGAVAGWRGHV